MLAVLSPAKSLNFKAPSPTRKHSLPIFLKESKQLITTLRQLSAAELSSLMGISSKLADLNYQRYAHWRPNFTATNAKQAAVAFSGDVYLGLQAEQYSERDFTWAQKHLRILSGLHGVLKPLDLIQPYRLEMGTKLPTKKGADLYEFWGNKITREINDAISQSKPSVLVNLASQEYFGVLDPDKINARILNLHFKDYSKGKYRFLSFYAKKARGLMASFIVKNRVSSVKALKTFDWQGYYYSEERSSENDWVFLRDGLPE